jgi:hypothetical protein
MAPIVLWGVGLGEGVGLTEGFGLASADGLALATTGFGVSAGGTLVVVQPARAKAASAHQAAFIVPEV